MEQKKRTIFYSWQSDDRESKNFIKNAVKTLEDAISPIYGYRNQKIR